MEKRSLMVVVILGVLIATLGFYLESKEKESGLPDDFTMRIYGDYTSGGGDRYIDSHLVFREGTLSSGWKKYDSISGRQEVLEKHYYCLWDEATRNWVDNETKGNCLIESINEEYLTVGGLETQIRLGTLKHKAICHHRELCYDLIN